MESMNTKIENLLAQMTLKEKVGQLNQRLLGFNCYEKKNNDFVPNALFINEFKQFGSIGFLYGLFRADPWSQKNYQNGIAEKDMAKTANTFQRYVLEHSRIKIPMCISLETSHGAQCLDGYSLPVNLAIGCSFNPALVEEAFSLVARQIAAAGVSIGIAPVLNILRDARWGRSEECYSEDAFLAASFARVVIRGLQTKVAAVAGQYCGQGAGAGGLNAAPVAIGERELREIHLPGAKACCDEGIKGFMASYNEVDGIPNHASKKLLTDVLRGEFCFDGIVMADGCALDRLLCLADTPEETAAIALDAGVDLSLWDNIYPYLISAVEKNIVSIDTINRSVRRVLKLKCELGLFDHPYVDDYDETRTISYSKNNQSLDLSRQTPVLLRNENNLLPLDSSTIKTIAVIGPNADDIYNQIGDYSATQKEGVCCTLLDGIKKMVADNCEVLYAKGCSIRGNDDYITDAVEIAQKADAVILALGGSSKRNFDIQFDSNGAVIAGNNITSDMDCGEGLDVSDLALGGLQYQLAAAIEKTGKPLVEVIIAGRPLCVSPLKAPALIYAFYPGPLGGLALAEIIFGKTLPSGKLSASLPAFAAQTDFCYNRKAMLKSMPYVDRPNESLFPFGFGLSYTTFAYSGMKAEKTEIAAEDIEGGASFHVSVQIKNTGRYNAYETAMLFISAEKSPITRRIKELKAFRKVFIKAGESASIDFTIGKDELGVWNRDMQFAVPRTKIMLSCGPCQLSIKVS
ncbi:MAG: glycoside hydrolase family 3 C-terminal domain-containing protein [Spirochaetaceae bacterium]|jgi:beta-glucosidase|nr:glycoside hydrolase family 3 C-terminal domain-containing protein [Spirochaetaceae bacterium]